MKTITQTPKRSQTHTRYVVSLLYSRTTRKIGEAESKREAIQFASDYIRDNKKLRRHRPTVHLRLLRTVYTTQETIINFYDDGETGCGADGN